MRWPVEAAGYKETRGDLAVGEWGTVRELGREETVQVSNTRMPDDLAPKKHPMRLLLSILL